MKPERDPQGSLPALLRRLLRRVWRPDVVFWLLLLSLVLLPLVMFQAVSGATRAQMALQAEEISTLATSIRAYYTDNVIARLQAANDKAVYSENYRDIHGGIPIPATLSIELGALFDNAHTDGRIVYEFISDYPFAKRAARSLDRFEQDALRQFRENPDLQTVTQMQGNGLGRSSYRLATPVLMRPGCVSCHNAHVDSPKRDWKVGDVRGIQQVTIRGMRVDGFGNLGALVGYVGVVGVVSIAATSAFRGQSQQLSQANRKLLDASERETALASRMAEQLQELSIFGNVVDNSIVGISVADMRKPDAPLIYVNHAFTVLTGYPKDLAVGFNCRFLQGPDTDPDEVDRIREALAEGRPYTGELINYRQDGTRFWNRLTLYPIGGTSGAKPDYFVANQVDITSLKQQAGVPMHELEAVRVDVDTARQALADAERFASALGQQLRRVMERGDADVALQAEAYLRSESQSHQRLNKVLGSIASLIARHASP